MYHKTKLEALLFKKYKGLWYKVYIKTEFLCDTKFI